MGAARRRDIRRNARVATSDNQAEYQAVIDNLNGSIAALQQQSMALSTREHEIMSGVGDLTPDEQSELRAINIAHSPIIEALRRYALVKIRRLNDSAYVRDQTTRISEINATVEERVKRANNIVTVVKNAAAFLKTLEGFLKALRAWQLVL